MATVKIPNGLLSAVIGAFNDFEKNRLPYNISVRLHNARKAFERALNERVDLQNTLVKQYVKPGAEAVKETDEGYEELRLKVEELYNTEIEVDFGNPIEEEKIAALGERVAVLGNSIDLLQFIGFLVHKNGSEPPNA